MAPPEMVKNIGYPGIFYRYSTEDSCTEHYDRPIDFRINQFNLGNLNVMVRTQVHAEDHETILEFEDVDSDDEKEKENSDDFFDIEEKGDDDEKVVENGVASLKLSASAAEWVPPAKTWNKFENSDMKWIKNDQVFNQPESRSEGFSFQFPRSNNPETKPQVRSENRGHRRQLLGVQRREVVLPDAPGWRGLSPAGGSAQ